jgi:hypothetical protein
MTVWPPTRKQQMMPANPSPICGTMLECPSEIDADGCEHCGAFVERLTVECPLCLPGMARIDCPGHCEHTQIDVDQLQGSATCVSCGEVFTGGRKLPWYKRVWRAIVASWNAPGPGPHDWSASHGQ